jgi:hypothetical protein
VQNTEGKLLINQLTVIFDNYYDYIGPGGITIIIAVTARSRKAQLPSPSQDETMAPTNKDSGATRMAGRHMFQAVQHPELDTLGLIAIRGFLKKQARYLRLVAQNNKADAFNVTPITVVASIDPELLEKLFDIEEIDEESIDDYTDESVMEFLKSSQERDASVTAEFVKAKVLAKVTCAMSEKDPALRVMKPVADCYSLHRNLRLYFINAGKPKKALKHLVSVIKPATLKALVESKLEMDMSELKKGLPLLCWLSEEDGYHTRRAQSCCGTQEDWRLRHEEHWQKQRRGQPQLWAQLWKNLT